MFSKREKIKLISILGIFLFFAGGAARGSMHLSFWGRVVWDFISGILLFALLLIVNERNKKDSKKKNSDTEKNFFSKKRGKLMMAAIFYLFLYFVFLILDYW